MSGQSDRSKLRTTDVPKNWCIYYHRPLWNDKLLNPKLPNICIVSRPIQRLKNNLSPTNIHNESNQEIELMNQESQKHKGIRSFHNDGYFFLIVIVSILTPQIGHYAKFGPNDHREDIPLFGKVSFGCPLGHGWLVLTHGGTFRRPVKCAISACYLKTLNTSAVSFLSHKSKVVFDLANLRIELNPLDGDDFSEVN